MEHIITILWCFAAIATVVALYFNVKTYLIYRRMDKMLAERDAREKEYK